MRLVLNCLCGKMPNFGTLGSVGKGCVCARPWERSWTLFGCLSIYAVRWRHSIGILVAPDTLKIWNKTKILGVELNLGVLYVYKSIIKLKRPNHTTVCIYMYAHTDTHIYIYIHRNESPNIYIYIYIYSNPGLYVRKYTNTAITAFMHIQR